MYYTYILKSAKDGTYYIGITSNLKKRLDEHNSGSARYTKTKSPWSLTWYAAFLTKNKAQDFETYLKTSSGFAFRNKRLI